MTRFFSAIDFLKTILLCQTNVFDSCVEKSLLYMMLIINLSDHDPILLKLRNVLPLL